MGHVMEVFGAIMNENGRVLIPAELRKSMGFVGGSELFFVIDDANLTLKTRKQLMEDARQALKIDVPKDVSLVDELIKSRREDAAKE